MNLSPATKENILYAACGIFAPIALFALLGNIAAPESTDPTRQLESVIAMGLIGVNVALNAGVWWLLPPKKTKSVATSGLRFICAVLLFTLTIILVIGLFSLSSQIRINESSLFGGDSGFAIFGTIGGSIIASLFSSIGYLIAQIVIQKRSSQ